MQIRSAALRAAALASLLAAVTPALAANYTVLRSLNPATDGSQPLGALVQARDGNFYGTTSAGGAGSCKCGTIFRITPAGAFTVLHTFGGADGAIPQGPMMVASDGRLYGTTRKGGANDTGTIFRITTAGAFKLMHSFAADSNFANADGEQPTGALIQGADGNFYGTALLGGFGDGTIFRMTPEGIVTVVHKMLFGEGGLPKGGLVIGPDGDFYGSAVFYGQAPGIESGAGTIFKISSSTFAFTTLYVFGGAEGSQPGQLMVGTDGKIYGTTPYGGANDDGIVFTVSPTGVLKKLFTFRGAPGGDGPQDALVQGFDGNFYSTTFFGGSSGGGTIFRMTPAGAVTVIHDFGAPGDGYWPYATIARGADGNFYGVTQYGGTFDNGVIFMMPGPNAPPAWITPPTPSDNAVLNLTATLPSSFSLRAGHADPLATVHIDAISKPSTAVLNAFDGNPGNATFQWTPPSAGDFVATFKASLAGAPLLAAPVRTVKLHVQKRATSIVAKPAVLEIAATAVHLHAIAVLSASGPTAPLAGKTVRFTTTDNKPICTANTDATGRADCTGLLNLVKTVLSRGYIATFAGDGAYQGSSQQGYLIQ